jgi:transposase
VPAFLVLPRLEDLSTEDRHLLDLLGQVPTQVTSACELVQAFAQMIRSRNASTLDPWLAEATTSGVPELRTFAQGIRRDQAAVLGALTHNWSQGQVEG